MNELFTITLTALVLAVVELLRGWLDGRRRRRGELRTRAEDFGEARGRQGGDVGTHS